MASVALPLNAGFFALQPAGSVLSRSTTTPRTPLMVVARTYGSTASLVVPLTVTR